MEITAAGMEADTVRPAYRPRYVLAAPSTTESKSPSRTARKVNSRVFNGDDIGFQEEEIKIIAKSAGIIAGKRMLPGKGSCEKR